MQGALTPDPDRKVGRSPPLYDAKNDPCFLFSCTGHDASLCSMPQPPNNFSGYELRRRSSEREEFDLHNNNDDWQHMPTSESRHSVLRPLWALINAFIPRRLKAKGYRQLSPSKLPTGSQLRLRRRRCCSYTFLLLSVLAVLFLLTAIFNPSYTRPPSHYNELRQRILDSDDDGPANPSKENIFIAASLYDSGGQLLNGAWGKAVLDLIELLGEKNVYLSIYENEGGSKARKAMSAFEQKVQSNRSIIWDNDFIMEDVPHVELPDGSRRVKRMAFLAQVRNKALEPLEEAAERTRFDKILYLNDVIFDPVEASQLLFSTNHDDNGRASYRTACAVDFINPFKFYDTFASRDVAGFSMGVPFFPWFTNSGEGISRRDVLQGKDAVRVRSCWGGMVAFDAEPFLGSKPLKFRATQDLYWDASECCLVNADLVGDSHPQGESDYGVYMNPYVRVAYSETTLRWLHTTRRFERLYTIPHTLINRMVGVPWHNPRREVEGGKMVEEKVWVPDSNLDTGGSFQMEERRATGDGFCGRRGLQVLKKMKSKKDEKNWEMIAVPAG